MKLKIFFVIKLLFFVSIELSAPYVADEYQPDRKIFTETGIQIFNFYINDDITSENLVLLNTSVYNRAQKSEKAD